jgi:hypothetical protein
MKAQGPWVIARTDIKHSQHGGEYVDITMINLDGEIAHTYIDPENRNAKNWQPIIQADQQDIGVILDDLRYKMRDGQVARQKRTNEPLIDADSRVRVKDSFDEKQQVIDRLAEELGL